MRVILAYARFLESSHIGGPGDAANLHGSLKASFPSTVICEVASAECKVFRYMGEYLNFPHMLGILTAYGRIFELSPSCVGRSNAYFISVCRLSDASEGGCGV